VAQTLVIEMNLGAPRADFTRGVFDFGFGAWPTIKRQEGVPHSFWFSKGLPAVAGASSLAGITSAPGERLERLPLQKLIHNPPQLLSLR